MDEHSASCPFSRARKFRCQKVIVVSLPFGEKKDKNYFVN